MNISFMHSSSKIMGDCGSIASSPTTYHLRLKKSWIGLFLSWKTATVVSLETLVLEFYLFPWEVLRNKTNRKSFILICIINCFLRLEFTCVKDLQLHMLIYSRIICLHFNRDFFTPKLWATSGYPNSIL